MIHKNKNIFALLITGLLSLHCLGMDREQDTRPLPEVITIETNDGHQHVVPINIYMQAGTIKNLVRDMREDAATTPIPLPHIANHTWNLLLPLLPHIQGEQCEAINNLLQNLSLEELSRIIAAADYLNIPFLIDCVAKEIARRLITAESKAEFRQNAAFLCNAGLCCRDHATHSEDAEIMSHELSRLIARKILVHGPNQFFIEILGRQADMSLYTFLYHFHTPPRYIWDRNQFNSICDYLQKETIIEQAMLLLCACDAMKHNTPLDLTNSPHLTEIYNSINSPLIREILVRANMVYTGQPLDRVRSNKILQSTATILSQIMEAWKTLKSTKPVVSDFLISAYLVNAPCQLARYYLWTNRSGIATTFTAFFAAAIASSWTLWRWWRR